MMTTLFQKIYRAAWQFGCWVERTQNFDTIVLCRERPDGSFSSGVIATAIPGVGFRVRFVTDVRDGNTVRMLADRLRKNTILAWARRTALSTVELQRDRWVLSAHELRITREFPSDLGVAEQFEEYAKVLAKHISKMNDLRNQRAA